MHATHPSRVQHLFTVDVEEHFHVSAFETIVPRDQWDVLPSRVAGNTDRLLDLLARFEVTGTFFVLGWVAQRYPGIVRRIAAAGHEVASHGQTHRRVTTLTPAEFREELRVSKSVLEDIAGAPVRGFRAPSFSIVPGREWAYAALVEGGYVYDSSVFPIRRSGYGNPDAPTVPHFIDTSAGALLELPLATTQWSGIRVPAAGGGYLRQFPYSVIRRAFREHDAAGVPAMFYVHPWEVDPDQPRVKAGFLTRVRHYRGLEKTMPRMVRLLSEFRFGSVARQLDALLTRATGARAAVA